MSEKIQPNENKKLDVLFGRELDIKGQFKDRLIHQHLKRDKKIASRISMSPQKIPGMSLRDS